MLKKYLKPAKVSDQVSLAILILRIGMALMIPHGYDKLLSLLDGANYFPDPLWVSPRISHGLTVFAELVCSIFFLAAAKPRSKGKLKNVTSEGNIIIRIKEDFLEKEIFMFKLNHEKPNQSTKIFSI